MRTSRFSRQQIQTCVDRLLSGEAIQALCDEYQVSARTIYRWRRDSEVMSDGSGLIRRELELEVERLRRRCLSLDHDVAALMEALVGRYDSIDDRRRIVDGFMRERRMSERHACELASLSRSAHRSRPSDRSA